MKQQNFNESGSIASLDSKLEKEYADLAKRVNVVSREESLPHKEALRGIISEEVGLKPEGNNSKKEPKEVLESEILPSYLSGEKDDVKMQVAAILDEAVHKGIFRAIKDSFKLRGKSPYLANSLHDALVDKLHEEMKSRNYL